MGSKKEKSVKKSSKKGKKKAAKRSKSTDETKNSSKQSVRRITIVTAAFIVVYTLVTGISESYSYDPGYYGELIIEDEEVLGKDYVEEEEYQPGYLDMLCKGGKRHKYCR